MSVRPESLPSVACLATSEGDLVSVSIAVQPRSLESLLEALAELDFPVNPQIYHDAALVSRYADGREEAAATTLVEFPAYSARAGEVRQAIERYGFDPESLQITGMLEELQCGIHAQPAPGGAPYVSRYRLRHAGAGRAV